MAKKATKKPGAPRRAKSATGKRSGTTKRPPAKAKSKLGGGGRSRRATGGQSGMSAADALVGLLESPLVAEVIAAGAAAALAAITQQALSKKSKGGSRTALKEAAKAAAAAMGTRLATELDEIMQSAKEAKSEKA